MFALESLNHAEQILSNIFRDRLFDSENQDNNTILRGPVGLFLIREDGASGSKLADEIMKSYRYWDKKTSHYFDGVFLGWGYEGMPVFLENQYIQCIEEFEDRLTWKDNGGAHVIITDFLYYINDQAGYFDFSKAIPLDITKLLKSNDWDHLNDLIIQGLLTPARDMDAAGTWEISDYKAILKLRQQFWKKFVQKAGLLLSTFDSVKDYAVRDLRKQTHIQ